MSEALDKLLKRQLVSQNDTPDKSTVIPQLSTSHVPAMPQPLTNEHEKYIPGELLSLKQRVNNSIELTRRMRQNEITIKLDKRKPTGETKLCPRCNEMKDRIEFKAPRGNSYYGYCNQCRKEYSKGYRLTGKGYKELFGENE